MHTAICAFDDQGRAEQALVALTQAGFDRRDLHIEHRNARTGQARANDTWDGLEREVAVDRGVLSSFGHFFTSLFGKDQPSAHADSYARHVERGAYVLVVDADDDAQARRASALLGGLQAGHLDVVHRPGQRRLRDLVDFRAADADAGAAVGAARSDMERAMASGIARPTTGPDLREPDLQRVPGLRYADKDKPD